MQQLELSFQTASPINVDKLSRQNRIVYQHLASGETITLFIAIAQYDIYNLHSRLSDLRRKHGIIIYARPIWALDGKGEQVKCKEYSLKPFIHKNNETKINS